MVKTYGELYLDARRTLMRNEDANTAGLLARELLCYAADMTREQVLAQREMYASEQICDKMLLLTQRLLNGEPLAYVIGQWEFYGMKLTVNPNVLIPRDDTCAVTDLAISQALFLQTNPRILDLCTGSGCIGLAIASRVKDAKVTLADISKDALQVAKTNVTAQKLSSRVSCVQANALEKPAAFWASLI